MKIFMIGGTGLLGSAAAKLMIERGHQVKSIALPPLPEGAPIPPEMELSFGNYLEMTDEEFRSQMAGHDAFVFAAGVDERIEFKKPVYAAYKKYNINPTDRLLWLAKEVGIKHAVVMGSYFSYFAKQHPELRLIEQHPYIRSRIDQEQVAFSHSTDGSFDVAVLELPYIFGTQPGRKPVWTILIKQLSQMKKNTMYPDGGTTMVTVRQVAEATLGALEKNRGANAYPIGYYNYTWDQFLEIVHEAMGQPERKIIHIPKWLFKLSGRKIKKEYEKSGLEPGIDPIGLAEIMHRRTWIDPKWSKDLGVTDDDIKAAIFDSIHLSVQAFKGEGNLLEMKGE